MLMTISRQDKLCHSYYYKAQLRTCMTTSIATQDSEREGEKTKSILVLHGGGCGAIR